MSFEKYTYSSAEYLALLDPYELRFELWDGEMHLKDGTRVVFLGDATPEGPLPDTALVVITNVTQEEIEQIAALVDSLRGRTG